MPGAHHDGGSRSAQHDGRAAVIVAAVVLGALIGLTMGALGGGGSILAVPALVFVLGLSPQQATTASLVIVGITAAVATTGHARSGHTRWRSGGLLAAVGVPASLVGTWLNRSVQPDVLLLAFATLILVAAIAMLLRGRRGTPDDDRPEPPSDRPPAGAAARADGPAFATTAVRTDGTTARRPLHLVRIAAVGLSVGFLTGFFGVGGGFVVVPVLVVLLGAVMPVAVGTSLLVIAVNCAVALAARAGRDEVPWEVVVPFTLSAVAATFAGQRVADRTDERRLTTAFAGLLVLVAVYVVVRVAVGRA